MATKLFVLIAVCALSFDQILASALPHNSPSDLDKVLAESNDLLYLSEAVTYANYYQYNHFENEAAQLLGEFQQRDDELTLSCILKHQDGIVSAVNDTHYAAKACTAKAREEAIIIALKLKNIKDQINDAIQASNTIISDCANQQQNATETLLCISNGYENSGIQLINLVEELKEAISEAKSELVKIYERTKKCLANVLEEGREKFIKVLTEVKNCIEGN